MWIVWLAAPLVVTALAAMVLWWRARPRRPIGTGRSIAGHQEYLRVLGANTVETPTRPESST